MKLQSKENRFLFTTIVIIFALTITAQSQTDISLEAQIYPTGFIPGITIDKHIGTRDVFYLRVGFNFFNHRDLGVQLNEEGKGYGFSLGYKRYLNQNQTGFRYGLKTDLWLNKVNWANINSFGPVNGETRITVIQPTGEVSYVWNFENIFFAPSLAFGFEWNVKTKGEPTGEGAILLVGAQIGKRF